MSDYRSRENSSTQALHVADGRDMASRNFPDISIMGGIQITAMIISEIITLLL